MSVNYNTIIGYGWVVDNETHTKMLQSSDYKYEDDFICTNYYTGNSNWFFGIVIQEASEGDYKPFSHDANIKAELVKEWPVTKLVELGFTIPAAQNFLLKEPKYWLINQIC